jgi:hypothetical protein
LGCADKEAEKKKEATNKFTSSLLRAGIDLTGFIMGLDLVKELEYARRKRRKRPKRMMANAGNNPRRKPSTVDSLQ